MLGYTLIHLYTYTLIYRLSDSKVTNFATLILRKVKEIGLIATTRFEDLDLNCVIGWFKKFWDRLMTSL